MGGIVLKYVKVYLIQLKKLIKMNKNKKNLKKKACETQPQLSDVKLEDVCRLNIDVSAEGTRCCGGAPLRSSPWRMMGNERTEEKTLKQK